MVSCSNCGLENDDSFAYCVRCGSNLVKNETPHISAPSPQVKECPQCGVRVPAMFRFCGTCGYPFGSAQPPKIEAPETPEVAAPAPPKPPKFTGPDPRRKSSRLKPPVPPPNFRESANNVLEQPPAPVEEKRAEANLIVINKDGSEGDSILITGSITKLGRATNHPALSEDPCLSPVHIVFKETPKGWDIADADSVNGVFIGLTDEPVPIEHGDQLRFGRQLVEFRLIQEDNKNKRDPHGTRLIGSEDYNYWALLAVISNPNYDCQVFPITGDVCVIGREKGNITMPGDYYVSGRHLEIRRIGTQYSVRDLNSSNGTYMRIKKPRSVRSEERIMMGQQLFLLRY